MAPAVPESTKFLVNNLRLFQMISEEAWQNQLDIS